MLGYEFQVMKLDKAEHLITPLLALTGEANRRPVVRTKKIISQGNCMVSTEGSATV